MPTGSRQGWGYLLSQLQAVSASKKAKALADFIAGVRVPFPVAGSISISHSASNGASAGTLAVKGRVKGSTRQLTGTTYGLTINGTTMAVPSRITLNSRRRAATASPFGKPTQALPRRDIMTPP